MAVSDADIAFAMDLFAQVGQLTMRKMFGGICIYQDGTVFSLVSGEGRIYLKCKGSLAEQLANDGGKQFHNMPYWGLPEAVLDDPIQACDLARQALRNL